MKYAQPYGVVDANASYTNGNPQTGSMGSIPPAASIEHPQREIVNHITNTGGTGLVPSATDLHQLSKAIQAGGVNYADDTGGVNTVVVALNPAPPALRRGLHVYSVIKNTNTGGATLKVNGLAAMPIFHLDGTALTAGEMKKNTLGLFCYDGNSWQWMSAPFVPETVGVLQDDANWFVDDATGDDSDDGLTAATAFRTIGRAIDEIARVNLNDHNVTVTVAPGEYTESVTLPPLSGNGRAYINGSPSNPGLTVIHPSSGFCIHWADLFGVEGWFIDGFKVTSTNDGTYLGQGILGGNGSVSLSNMEFGPCNYAHVVCGGGCRLTLGGPTTKWKISGGAQHHMIFGGASLINLKPQMEITNAPNFSQAFIWLNNLSIGSFQFTSITPGAANSGHTVTGKKFKVDSNSIMTVGAGLDYLPGSIAGTTNTGGQYI